MARNYKGIDASLNKFIDMADAAINSVESMQLRAHDVKPAMQLIVQQFQIMEAERFARRGRSPSYGHYDTWQPDSDATLQRRYKRFGIETTDPLKVTGMLQKAATNPQVAYSPQGAIIGVNVRASAREFGYPQGMSQQAWDSYSRNRDYGLYHQQGSGKNPKRSFVGIETPQFRVIAKKIVAAYVWGESIEEFGLKQKAILRDNKRAPEHMKFKQYVSKSKDRNARRKTGHLQVETEARYARGYTKEAQAVNRAAKDAHKEKQLIESMKGMKFESFESWMNHQHPRSGEWLWDHHQLTWDSLGGRRGYETFVHAAKMHANNPRAFAETIKKAGITPAGAKFYNEYGVRYFKETGGNLK